MENLDELRERLAIAEELLGTCFDGTARTIGELFVSRSNATKNYHVYQVGRSCVLSEHANVIDAVRLARQKLAAEQDASAQIARTQRLEKGLQDILRVLGDRKDGPYLALGQCAGIAQRALES